MGYHGFDLFDFKNMDEESKTHNEQGVYSFRVRKTMSWPEFMEHAAETLGLKKGTLRLRPFTKRLNHTIRVDLPIRADSNTGMLSLGKWD